MAEVSNMVKFMLIGLTSNEIANSIYFKTLCGGNINIREFDSTNINTIVKYKMCCNSSNYLNVYSRNGKIFAVGKISEGYC
jgi:hypothetical protein